jgi:hypothetical protein
MNVDVSGKYIDAGGKAHPVTGTLSVDRWEKSERSPDPALYTPSGTWHPARWTYAWNDPVPEDIKHFTMERLVPGHFLRWAAGPEYGEGLAIARDPAGNRIGQGFQESVAYGQTAADTHRIAGIPDDPATLALLANEAPGFGAKASAAGWLLSAANRAQLQSDLEKARGL